VRLRIVVLCALACLLCGQVVSAQKRKVKNGGAVCGDPPAACSSRKNFHEWDLPFNTGRNFVIIESAPFYGIVLKSVKLKDFGDCDHPSFRDSERSEIQELFEHNKVFTQNCLESGSNYYTGVPEKSAFIGVYAGRTLAEATRFLKTVQALNKFPGIRVRRMKVAINGT
jgi:hypothetical protein